MNNEPNGMRRFFRAVFIALMAASAILPGRIFAADAIDTLFSYTSFSGLAACSPETPPAASAGETYPLGVFDVKPDRIYYLLPSQVDMSQVPPAPAAGSAVDKEDLAGVLRWQVERTEAQCAAADAQSGATYDDFFGEISPFENPAPAEVKNIFQKVRADTGGIVYSQKEKYKRPRPFQRDPAITPCIGRESGHSYPSGHSAAARVFGLILSDLVPASASRFMSYADQAALNRVIGGVHHPSDIEAGKNLGDAIYTALKRNQRFNTDMETLRGNLKY